MTGGVDDLSIPELVRLGVERGYSDRIPGLKLTGIDRAAVNASRAWFRVPERRYAWDWFRILKRSGTGRFDLAMWSGALLCGLAYGPEAADYAAIHYLEGCPHRDHPLRGYVLPVAVAAVELQAALLRKPEIRLLEPEIVSPGVV